MSTQVVMDETENEEGQLHKWLSQNGKNLLYGVATAAVILLFLFQYTSSERAQAEVDYMKAEARYLDFRMNQGDAPLPELREIMARRPELHQKYNAMIAQVLMARGEEEEGVRVANEVLAAGHGSDEVRDFSETSLLLTSGDLDAAWERMGGAEAADPLLASHALFRTKLLAKERGQSVSYDEFKSDLDPRFIEHLKVDEKLLVRLFSE